MPYHTEQLFKKEQFNILVKSAVKDNFAEFQAKELSLELKLSEEMHVPLHMVPNKISAVIKMADIAKAFYPELNNPSRIIPVGIILKDKRIMYVDHLGLFRYPEQDSTGYYRFLTDGTKHYLYLK